MSNSDLKFDPLEYWENRHAALIDNYRNVGDIRLTSQQNQDLIINKALLITYVLGLHSIPRGARILDAGCGAGFLTALMHSVGFEMTGIDGSQTAILSAVSRSVAQFHVVPLSAYISESAFDVVMCLDVLFHIVDDAEWERSMDRLVDNTKLGGLLVLIESFTGYGEKSPNHVHWRCKGDYDRYFTHKSINVLREIVFRYPHQGIDQTLIVGLKST